jgi:hypothetical protein
MVSYKDISMQRRINQKRYARKKKKKHIPTTIDPKQYEIVNKEMRKLYKECFGTNDFKLSKKASHNDKVKRYHDELVFWTENDSVKQDREATDLDEYKLSKSFYCSGFIVETRDTIKKLSNRLRNDIEESFDRYLDSRDPLCDIFDKYNTSKSEHENKMKEAKRLFDKAHKETLQENIPSPPEYLLKQNEYRNTWSEYLEESNTLNSKTRGIFMKGSFAVYMNYMQQMFLENYGQDLITVIMRDSPHMKDCSDKDCSDKDCSDKDCSDKDCSDKDCSDKDCSDKDCSDKADSDKDGLDKADSDKADSDKDGLDKANSDKADSDKDGLDKDGLDKDGLDKDGLDKDGLDKDGLDKDGLDKADSDKADSDKDGLDKDGLDRADSDKDGLDKDSLDKADSDKD